MRRSHYFATEQERREAMRASFARIKGTWKWRLSLLAVFVLTFAGCAIIPRIPWRVVWLAAVASGGWSLFLILGLNLAWRRTWTLELRKVLRQRGIPICLHCGYDLRGLTEARCPECGNPFEPEILTWQQAEPIDHT
jgi:hypothetical protein